jgi:hypothetical protein
MYSQSRSGRELRAPLQGRKRGEVNFSDFSDFSLLVKIKVFADSWKLVNNFKVYDAMLAKKQ